MSLFTQLRQYNAQWTMHSLCLQFYILVFWITGMHDIAKSYKWVLPTLKKKQEHKYIAYFVFADNHVMNVCID